MLSSVYTVLLRAFSKRSIFWRPTRSKTLSAKGKGNIFKPHSVLSMTLFFDYFIKMCLLVKGALLFVFNHDTCFSKN